MLKLRRATVLQAGPIDGTEQELEISLDGERRPAISDIALRGESRQGDEVVVNVQARDLGLGSGGFDIVHVNLTRGLDGAGTPDAHVMKLNYTSLQHAVRPVEDQAGELTLPVGRPVAVLGFHGLLSCVAWEAAQR